jgi:TPP-dependent pyruvate/acetoin dehydrogenase alpha subunit
MQERDPIERIRKLLLSREIATVAELKVIIQHSYSCLKIVDS